MIEPTKLALSKARARAGVEATKSMKAAFGNAVCVDDSAWNEVPDPGAEGLLCLFEGLAGESWVEGSQAVTPITNHCTPFNS